MFLIYVVLFCCILLCCVLFYFILFCFVLFCFIVRIIYLKIILLYENCSLCSLTEPSRAPENLSSTEVNSTTNKITWVGLPREVANGIIRMYEVRLSVLENCAQTQPSFYSTINTSSTYVFLTGLSLCAKYEVSVRGYTVAGPGPFSRPIMVQTLGK